jgi:hypothetical protein
MITLRVKFLNTNHLRVMINYVLEFVCAFLRTTKSGETTISYVVVIFTNYTFFIFSIYEFRFHIPLPCFVDIKRNDTEENKLYAILVYAETFSHKLNNLLSQALLVYVFVYSSLLFSLSWLTPRVNLEPVLNGTK